MLDDPSLDVCVSVSPRLDEKLNLLLLFDSALPHVHRRNLPEKIHARGELFRYEPTG
jgi:hypothetical protein